MNTINVSAGTTTIPVSFFRSVKHNTAYLAEAFSWERFVAWLRKESGEAKANKEAAELFAPTIFNGRRCVENVGEAGMVVLDIDHDANLESVLTNITHLKLEAVVYTTASSRFGDDRFRVVVPLEAPVDADTYKVTFKAINAALGNIADPSKPSAVSLFYFPGQYPNANNRFEHVRGEIWSAAKWNETFPPDVNVDARHRDDVPIPRGWLECAELGELYSSPFVSQEWVSAYLSLPKGKHHHGLYTFMVKVAMSAIAQGVAPDACEVERLARDLDRADGGWYPDRQIEKEAERAVAFAVAHVSPPAANKKHITDTYAEIDAETAKIFGFESVDGTSQADVENAVRPEVPEEEPAVESTDVNLVRPPLRMWIDEVQPYAFDDQAFVTGRGGLKTNPTYQFLAERCVGTKSGFVVKESVGWVQHSSKATAQAALYNNYGGKQGNTGITLDGIKKFFGPSGGIVMIQGECVAPGGSEFITYRGQRLANLYRDQRISGRLDCVAECEVILRLIREALCDLPRSSLEKMIDEIHEGGPTLFRWVMHWLASAYARPGYHIGTALWFLGELQGTGKGTLVQIMRQLIGAEWCRRASSSEIAKGWNDFMSRAILIEADEFSTGSRADLNDSLKEWIGNPSVVITKRHTSSVEIPNTSNWLVTTNNPNPILVEATDRRHTFVATTNDPGRKQLAVDYHALAKGEASERQVRALQGFAALLCSISIDDDLLRVPFVTDKKLELMAMNISPVERWFAAEDRCWRVGEQFGSSTLWIKYLSWVEVNDPHCFVRTQTAFGVAMGTLAAKGFVKKGKPSGHAYTKLKYYKEDTEHFMQMSKPGRLKDYCESLFYSESE